MNLTNNDIVYEPVSKFVTDNYKTAEVFKKHGIDFCCGGRISLGEACDKAGVEIETVQKDLADAIKEKSQEKDFDNMPLDELIDHILRVHHSYVAENLPLLKEYTAKIAEVHYDTNPELKDIHQVFLNVAEELEQHMMKEEQILFPYIMNMVNPEKYPGAGGCGAFGTVQSPIAMMEHEHESAGEAFRKIRELTDDFDYPPHACNTYIVTFKKLEEFEDDLHKHIHLENNILFPKAISIEKDNI